MSIEIITNFRYPKSGTTIDLMFITTGGIEAHVTTNRCPIFEHTPHAMDLIGKKMDVQQVTNLQDDIEYRWIGFSAVQDGTAPVINPPQWETATIEQVHLAASSETSHITCLNPRVVVPVDTTTLKLLMVEVGHLEGKQVTIRKKSDGGKNNVYPYTFVGIKEQVVVDNGPEPVQEPVKQNTLEEANEIIHGARAADYGSASESFSRIAALWLLQLDSVERDQIRQALDSMDNGHLSDAMLPNIAPAMCKMLMAVKLARQSNKHKRDNIVDLGGYGELLNQLNEEDEDGE